MELKGSRTEQNLLKAFAGESQARNRYTYFASQAKKDGFQQIMAIFQETAEQEKEHAKVFFKYLEGGDLKITAEFPAGIIGTTAENLKAAADGEKHEHSAMYPEFANVATEEGFHKIAATFKMISVAEQHHERRYRDLLKEVEAGTVFKKKEKVVWTCSNCGWTHEGTDAPAKCSACQHPQEYFQILCEKY
jgi:rubrerythrin